MIRTILTYGAISGLIIIGVNTFNLEMGLGEAWLGFLVMFIAFSAIYVAVKQYRDEALGGSISFLRALSVGLGIAFIASIVYVSVWELYSYFTDYAFIEHYTESLIETAKLSTASDAQIANAIADANTLREQYANPLFRLPMTFVEVFPVGLLFSIVSAMLLRAKKIKIIQIFHEDKIMKLGIFSLSLAVKSIERSKAFYETLGFEVFAGELDQNWLIMKNGDHCIGLFQGMFDSNIMTFNPGWDKDCNALESFDDVRELRDRFSKEGVKINSEAISGDSGPANFTIEDPDGNTILFDQHV